MSRFNTKVNNTTTNLAGGKAFKMDAEQELLHTVLTTFLEYKGINEMNLKENYERFFGKLNESSDDDYLEKKI